MSATGQGATSLSAIVNTVNTVIGSGVLVLPYALRTDSIFLGTCIIIFAGLANCVGMILQGAASKFLPQGTATFFTVCKLTYPKLSVLFDFAIFLQCFGVNISYLVLTGDILPLVYKFDNWDNQSMKNFYIIASVLIILPLSLMKKIDSLKYASVIALISIVYICILIYGNFFYALKTDFKFIPEDKLGDISVFKPQGIKPIFKTLGIIVLAYTCPTQFSIISELQDPSLKNISNISIVSMLITAFIFLSISYSGYLTFGNALSGNILLMYENNIYTQIGRALLILMIVLSFPLMFHPARISFNNVCHVIKQYIKERKNKDSNKLLVNDASPLMGSSEGFENLRTEDDDDQESNFDVEFSDTTFYIISIILLVVSYISALTLNSFELILSIVGSTGGVLISFVLPGFYGYKLIANNDESLTNKLFKNSPDEFNNPIFECKLLKKVSLFLIIWGLMVMVICLYSTLID